MFNFRSEFNYVMNTMGPKTVPWGIPVIIFSVWVGVWVVEGTNNIGHKFMVENVCRMISKAIFCLIKNVKAEEEDSMAEEVTWRFVSTWEDDSSRYYGN